MLFLNLLPLSFLLMLHNAASFREYSKQDLANLRDQVKDVFYHAYNGYLNHAFPYDELRPLSCDGIDTWGSYSLTLIDALDTLAIMGNYSEFSRVVDLITERANFDVNINVSVFETNIRIVGGLLSAHLLSEKAGLKLEPGWPCNGPLLRLAEDVAKRLLPAFDTVTGMPYGTVNLRSGVPLGETPVTCTAGVGTFIVEFGTLSRLTGDPVYEEVALHALRSLYKRRSNIGLFGNHIDTKTGIWTAQDSGIGAGVDSYFEYLVKGAILFQRPELLAMFNEIRGPIEKYLKRDDWYMWVSMHKGQFTLPVFQSLEAFWPGVLSLVGDVNGAMKSLHNYHQVWKQYGFLPEFYNIVNSEVSTNRESYPLRPELAESVMYLYRATGDPYLLDVGEDILLSIEHSARTPCGYATIRNVVDHSQEDRMESFFLAETTKYLYLLFDTENFIHNDGSRGKVFETDAGKLCVLGAGGYVFNTEAHPIDQSALHCCSDEKLGDMNVEIRRRDMKREREVETKEEEIKGNDATEADEKGKELSEKGDQDVDNTSVQNEGIENDNGLLHEDIKITRIPTTEAVYKSDATFGNAQSNTKLKENVAEPSLLEEIQERLAQLGNRKEENSNEKNGNYKSSNIGNAQSSNINDELSNGGNIQLQNSENELSNRGKRRKKRAIEENTRALNTSDQISSEDIRKNNNPPSPKKRNQSAPEKLTENQMSKEKFTEDQIASEVITKSQQSSTRELLDALFNDTLHIINEEMTGVELLDGSNMQKALLAFTIKMHAKQKKITAILSENLAEVERGLLNLTGDRLERLEKMEKHQARLDSFNIDQKRQAGIVTMFGEKMRQIQIRAMELQGVSPEESAHRVDKRQRDMDKVVAGEGNQGFDFGPKVLFPEDLLRDFNISVKSSMPSPPGEDNGTLEDDRAAPPPDLGVQKPEGNQPFKSSLVQDTQNDGYAVQENQEESGSSIIIDVKKAFDRDSSDGKNPTDGFSAAENQNRISESGKGENDEVPAENETDECAGLENDSLRLCQLANRPPPLVFNPQTLYAKIKSQESAHSSVCVRHASHALLTCSPQSFFTRWSLRGEFFDPPESNKQP